MLYASIISFIAIWFATFSSAQGQTPTYKDYVPDFSPLEADAKLAREYKEIFNPDRKDTITRDHLKRAYDIISTLVRKNPNWVDGYWLLGSVAFQWGGSY